MQILEYIIIPVISLIVLFIITKMMGYRQVSQLNMYDYINGITIGSIASELVMGGFDNILQPLIAMVVYAIVIILLSKAACSSLKLRKLIDGQAVVLYENNQIYNEELEKARILIQTLKCFLILKCKFPFPILVIRMFDEPKYFP